jgi:hypothetical protein
MDRFHPGTLLIPDVSSGSFSAHRNDGLAKWGRPEGFDAPYQWHQPAIEKNFDRRVGHHRRYTCASLTRVLERAGFEVDAIHYVNSFGAVLWWLGIRTFGLDPAATRAASLKICQDESTLLHEKSGADCSSLTRY